MHYKQLDGLRFLAAAAVIFHHVCPLPEFFSFDLGHFGVDLFFVISGFLITEILLKQRVKSISPRRILSAFFIRRALRIFPLYYLYILLCYILAKDYMPEYVYWLLTYSLNFWIVIHDQLAFWWVTHLWSLAVEEQFYVVWPFLLMAVSYTRTNFVFVSMIVIAVIIRLLVTLLMPGGNDLFNYTMLPATLDCFGAGALLAYLKLFKPQLLMVVLKHKYLILIAALAISVNNKFGTELSHQTLNRSLDALLGFYLVGVATVPEFKYIFGRFLSNRMIIYFGQISYGLYVYHLMAWGELKNYFISFWTEQCHLSFELQTRPYVEFLYVLICTVIIAAISYELVEKRFLNLKKHFSYAH